VNSAPSVSCSLSPLAALVAFVALGRLAAGAARRRFDAGTGSPAGSTLMFSAGVATHLGVRLMELAKTSNGWVLRRAPSSSVSSVAGVAFVVARAIMRPPVLQG